MKTPEKNNSNNSTLKAIRTVTTPTSRNNTIVTTRLALIVKTLEDTYNEWEFSQTKACNLIHDVSRLNDKPEEIEEENLHDFYISLEEDCRKIKELLATMHDLVQTTKKSVDELKALWAISDFGYDVYYKSWDLPQFVKATERTAQMMEDEYKVKKIALHEWTHATQRADIELHRSMVKYSDDYLNLRFKFHSIEKG